MSNSAFQTFGGTRFPLAIDDVTEGLTSLDPARDRLLNLFESAINSEFGDAWTIATNAHGLSTKLRGTLPVADKLQHEPSKGIMQERKCAFPLLALHRTGEPEFEPFLVDHDLLTQDWHLHYILGPLDIDGQRRLLDICQAIGKLIAAVIRNYGHRSFESGANQLELAGLNTLRIKSMTGPGPAQFDDGDTTVYWAARYTLESTELTEDSIDQESDFNGFDLSLDAGGAGEEDVSPDFISASSDPEFQYP